jgi:hypothetical protein
MKFLYVLCLCCLLQPIFAQNTNYYTVKFPDDQSYVGCGANVPIVNPIVTQYGCSFNVGISRNDQVFNLNATGTCYKILRRWRLVYWCDYDPNTYVPTVIANPSGTMVGPTAVGNPANHGFLEYTQEIKVRDADSPLFASCPTTQPVVFCDFTNNNTALYGQTCEGPVELSTEVTDACSGTDINLLYRLYLDLDANGSMETYIYSNGPNAYPIEKTIDGSKVRGKIVFPANFQLPYGLHKVEWVANDNCGNEAVCKYEFLVKDCKNPTIVCHNGLSINIMQTGMVSLWASDFIQYTQDNCTPSNLIKTGIRKAGTGTGFPTNSPGVTFDCTEIGTQPVEVWALDANGNADYCLTYVIVQDNSGTCVPTATLSGTVLKSDGSAMPEVQVQVMKQNNTPAAAAISAANGGFGPLPLWPGCYNLVAHSGSTDLASTHISTWDALMAGMQAEGVTPFDQPWQYAAADVNGDGWITPEDGWAIAQMAIGGAYNWPNAPVWQFIAANSAIPQDQIQLVGNQALCIAAGNTTPFDWVGFKMGDLDNSSANNGNKPSLSNRMATFSAQDQSFEANGTVTITIAAPHIQGLAGFQWTLDYNPAYLSVASVQGTDGLEHVQFARFDADHQITAAWQNAIAFYPDGAALFSGKNALTIVFNTLQAGKLSDVVAINDTRIQTEVYTRGQERHAAKLAFTDTPLLGNANRSSNGIELLPISPDPVVGTEIMVRYTLPATTDARVLVADEFGKIVAEQQVDGSAGYHEVAIPVNTRRAGAYSVQVVTGLGMKTDRFLKQ